MPRFVFLLLLLCLSLPMQAWALASDWQKDDAVAVRLISSTDGVGQGDSVPLGIDVELQPNWHTYWRSPGAAGLPPQLDWHTDTASNLKQADLLYPAPKRYTAYGLETIGYRDHVVLPVTAVLQRPGEALNATVALSLLVCSDTCVPKNFTLSLTIPAGEAKPSAEAPLLQQFQAEVPQTADTGLSISDITLHDQILTFTIQSTHELQAPDLFIEDDKDIGFTKPDVTLSEDKHSAQLIVSPADALPNGVTLAGMPLTVTLTDGDQSAQAHVIVPSVAPIAPAPALPEPATHNLPLGLAILFALIGGFILNLMPCVLPVLSLKLLSVIGHGGRHSKQVRYSFLASAAGIMFSFLVLAGMTIALKTLGLSIGWGVQFQQPLFLTALILIVTFFTANMWGFGEITLPRLIADVAGKATHHRKLAGDFLSGAFATLLATPCTAPFLGTAVGFALASGPRDILIIFTALGCGMTLPYLAIALFPKTASALPKPGIWMIRLRWALGLCLASTVLWLLWVLAAQVSHTMALQVALCMLALVLLMALRQRTRVRRYSNIGLGLLIAASFLFVATGAPPDKNAAIPDALWTPFDENLLASDVAAGKTVFVDVTADWCLTCKANKKFVLSQQDVTWKLFHGDIVAMQADWTNPDPIITAYLQKYGRYGIPFNIVYGPAAPQGIVLPELLSKSLVLDALSTAQGVE